MINFRTESESTQFEEWKENNPEVNPEQEFVPKPESAPETESEGEPLAWDPFRTDNTCREEIEFKALHFNPIDHFLI